MAATVSVSVPGSQAGVQWAVFISGLQNGTVIGPGPYGPVYLGPGDILSLQGSPPAGSTSGNACITGTLGLISEVPPTSPTAGGGQGPPITQLGSGNGTYTPSPTATALIIETAAALSLIIVTGVTSGIVLPVIPYGPALFVVPLPGDSVDQQFNVELVAAPGVPIADPPTVLQVTQQAAVIAIPPSTFYSPMLVGLPAAAAIQWPDGPYEYYENAGSPYNYITVVGQIPTPIGTSPALEVTVEEAVQQGATPILAAASGVLPLSCPLLLPYVNVNLGANETEAAYNPGVLYIILSAGPMSPIVPTLPIYV
jgi:hypothetical protein